MSNWLDRTIGWLSPVRGAKRVQARRMMEALAYDGARRDRRTSGWTTLPTDADTEVSTVVGILRDNARDLVRNNPYASAAVDVKVTETIGAGIVAEVKNQRLRSMWERFVDECDADGHLDLYGIQALIERCRAESGEVLVQFIQRPIDAADIRKGRVPLWIRVLEPDHIDASRDTYTKSDNGTVTRHGIVYDPNGNRLGYWLYPEHPGSSKRTMRGALGLNSRFVPADEILHVYRRLRPGQTRGVTDFAPVILRMRDLGDHDDAYLMRKKVEACLAVFVSSPAGSSAQPLAPVTTDSEGRVEGLSPGMIEYLRAGESVTFSDPKAAGDYADFERFTLRAISAGLGTPYELVTGDLSQVNYSSYRAGLIRFRRRLEQDQWQMHIPQHCVPIWNRFLGEARVIVGNPQLGANTTVEWTPPRFELIDPLKETQAEIEAVLAGFDSWPEVVRRRGWTASEQLDEIEAWQKELSRRGIVLKSDYRNQSTPMQATAAEPDEDDDEEAAA